MKRNASEQDTDFLINRAYGCLAGVAVGDSMGMPTSLLEPPQIHELYPDGIDELLPAPPGHPIHNGMTAGTVTDDTQQTLLVAEYLLDDDHANGERLAWSLIRWAEKINGFDSDYLGPSTQRALEFIRAGGSVDEAGWRGDTNGAAMRIAPVGIIHPGDYPAVVKDTAQVCRPTHNTNVAISGASGIACAIAAGMAGETLNGVVAAYLYGVEEGLKHGNSWAAASIRRRSLWAMEMARTSANEKSFLTDLYDLIGMGVAMVETAPASIALFAYYEGDPMRVVKAVANLGGDADTIGAIAGSIAGAYKGIDAIPKELLTKIEKVNDLDLASMARRLVERSLVHN